MNKKNFNKEIKGFVNLPLVVQGNRLYGSVNYLANIEMFVFARLGLTWEQVLMYNPIFDTCVTEEDYNEFVTFVNEESELYDNIRVKFLKLIKKLDKVRDASYQRREFKRIDKI